MTLAVSRNAAVKTPKAVRAPIVAPVKTIKWSPALAEYLRKIDIGRIQILNSTTAIVWNSPEQRAKLARKVSK